MKERAIYLKDSLRTMYYVCAVATAGAGLLNLSLGRIHAISSLALAAFCFWMAQRASKKPIVTLADGSITIDPAPMRAAIVVDFSAIERVTTADKKLTIHHAGAKTPIHRHAMSDCEFDELCAFLTAKVAR